MTWILFLIMSYPVPVPHQTVGMNYIVAYPVHFKTKEECGFMLNDEMSVAGVSLAYCQGVHVNG